MAKPGSVINTRVHVPAGVCNLNPCDFYIPQRYLTSLQNIICQKRVGLRGGSTSETAGVGDGDIEMGNAAEKPKEETVYFSDDALLSTTNHGVVAPRHEERIMGPNIMKVDRKGKGGSLPDSESPDERPPAFMMARENLGEQVHDSSSMDNHPRKSSSQQSESGKSKSPVEQVEGTAEEQNLHLSVAGMHIDSSTDVEDESRQSIKRKRRSWTPSPASDEDAHADDEESPKEVLKRRIRPVRARGARSDTKPDGAAGEAFSMVFYCQEPCIY